MFSTLECSFSKLKFKSKKVLFTTLLVTMMIPMVAELIIDGKLPSINWVSKFELSQYNSIGDISRLELIVETKIASLLQIAEEKNMRTVWMDIIDEIQFEFLNGRFGYYLTDTTQKEYFNSMDTYYEKCKQKEELRRRHQEEAERKAKEEEYFENYLKIRLHCP